MTPLVDTHCHLCAGLDDGPQTPEDALAMCAMAHADGVRLACATAHQNEDYPENTPARVRGAADLLAAQLRQSGLDLTVVPCGEVIVRPDLDEALARGELLTVGGHGKYLLIEYPHGLFVDILPLVARLTAHGVRPILAHPERTPELLDSPEEVRRLVAAGCLLQVVSRSVTQGGRVQATVRQWFKDGLVHLLGSDGHSPRRRRPLMGDAYRQIVRWVGPATADRVCSGNGLAVVQGLPLRVEPPLRPRVRWLPRWLGG